MNYFSDKIMMKHLLNKIKANAEIAEQYVEMSDSDKDTEGKYYTDSLDEIIKYCEIMKILIK